MKRRGFLSLLVATPVALVVERVLPAKADFRRMISPTGLDNIRIEKYMLGFQPELGFQEIVEPGGVIRLVAYCPRVFRPDRILFSNVNLDDFELLQVETDEPDDNRLFLSGAIPANFFSPFGWGGARLEFATIQPEDEIELVLRNTSSHDSEFGSAAMLGLVRL